MAVRQRTMPRVFGDFMIQESIGKGRFAEVFRAEQAPMDRLVALKVLEEPAMPSQQFAQRFFREVKAMARLEHPHVVPIYAAGQSGRYYYIAMRWLKDGSLADRLAAGQPINLAAGLTWLRQAVWGAAAAHRRGIVHRDINPANILLDSGIAFLADFGLAAMQDMPSLTAPGTLLGTPLYMAPEQLTGAEASTPQRDVFSFGITIYLLVTGRHPFAPEELDAKLSLPEACHLIHERIRAARYPRAGELVPGLPPLLDQVIARCLRNDPAERYADAAALLADLNTVQFQVGSADTSTLGPDAEPGLYGSREPAVALKSSATQSLMRRLATTVMADAPGAKNCGGYQLADEVGHGFNGVVYRALDNASGSSVAVKLLSRDRGYGKTNFPGPLHQAAELGHPHLVKILDLGIEGDSPYVVEELIRGPSLKHVIESGTAIPLAFALEVVRQAAEALAYAHGRGVTHLDLKPSDVLFRSGAKLLIDGSFRLRAPSVALSDFGLRALRREVLRQQATAVSSLSLAGAPASYYSYTSPEQVDGRQSQPDERADVYSLAAVLYELLAGRPPHLGADAERTAELVTSAEVESPRKHHPNIPVKVEELCLRALSRDPAKRHASAGAFEKELAALTRSR